MISSSTQFPPDAPVSNNVLIATFPISMSAEHLNSRRVYPELSFPTVLLWLAPLAIENPAGKTSKRRCTGARVTIRPLSLDVAPTCSRMGMHFVLRQPSGEWAQVRAAFEDTVVYDAAA